MTAILTFAESKGGKLRRASLEAERSAIEKALYRTSWNRKQAARLLGVSYKTLLLKIRECGLEGE